MTTPSWLELAQAARPRLRGLAYRMLGSVAEADDIVQEAMLRMQAVDVAAVRDPQAYLHTVVARLCLDRVKSAQARREVYVGTWLPEPMVDDASAPDVQLGLRDDISFALLMTLEKLTPPERTAFLLHDVFGQSFADIALLLKREPAACRKLAERARAKVHADGPRAAASAADEQRLGEAFLAASAQGDVEALKALLTQDAVLYNDGGGKRLAALNPIVGPDRIARFIVGLQRKAVHQVPTGLYPRRVNQLPGHLITYDNGDVAVSAYEVHGALIRRIYVINNPDKLLHLRGS